MIKQFREITVGSLLHAFDESRVKFNESYQRHGELWSASSRSALIDTVILGYLVPTIMVRVSFDSDGREIYEVIDGRQRFTSLIQFRNNKIPWVSINGNRTFFSKLMKEDKERFLTYLLGMYSLKDATDQEVRETFSRLNREGKTLNTAETRHGRFQSGAKELINKLANKYKQMILSTNIITEAKAKRMKDRHLFAEIIASISIKDVAIYPQTIDKVYEEKLSLSLNPKTLEDRVCQITDYVFELQKELPAKSLKSYSFVSLCMAVYANRWGGIEVGGKQCTRREKFPSTTKVASRLTTLFEIVTHARESKSIESDDKYAEFILANLKTTDSKRHREIRMQWFLKALQQSD